MPPYGCDYKNAPFWRIIDFNWTYEEQQALVWECKQLEQFYDM